MTWIPKSVPKPEGRGKRPPHPLKRAKMKTRSVRTKKSGGHLFPKGVDEGLREWIRALPCCVNAWGHNMWGVIEVAHVKSRGAGGVDRANVVPLCTYHHSEQHALGMRSFEKRYGVNLKAIAHALTAQYEAEKFPCT